MEKYAEFGTLCIRGRLLETYANPYVRAREEPVRSRQITSPRGCVHLGESFVRPQHIPDVAGLTDRCPELALEAKQSALSLDRESRFIRNFERSIERMATQQSSRYTRLQRVQCDIFSSIEYDAPDEKSSANKSANTELIFHM